MQWVLAACSGPSPPAYWPPGCPPPRMDEHPPPPRGLSEPRQSSPVLCVASPPALGAWLMALCLPPSLPGLAPRGKNLLRAVGHVREAATLSTFPHPTPFRPGDMGGCDTTGVAPGIQGWGRDAAKPPHKCSGQPPTPENDAGPNSRSAEGEKLWPGSHFRPACWPLPVWALQEGTTLPPGSRRPRTRAAGCGLPLPPRAAGGSGGLCSVCAKGLKAGSNRSLREGPRGSASPL